MRPEKICLLFDLVGTFVPSILADPDIVFIPAVTEFIAGLYAVDVLIAFSIMLISFMASFQFYE